MKRFYKSNQLLRLLSSLSQKCVHQFLALHRGYLQDLFAQKLVLAFVDEGHTSQCA